VRILIVRHGKAHDADLIGRVLSGGSGGSDFDRNLTARGEDQARFLAERIAAVEPRPQAILTSRYPRALQTATTIQESLDCPLSTERGLEVDHPIGEVLSLIEREHRAGRKSIMLVGHNPQLGELVAVLASGLSSHEMILKTGELVALEVRPQQMIGSAKIVGRLRLSGDKNDESIAGGVFAVGTGGTAGE
jgi:phosphohistidine phosphatase